MKSTPKNSSEKKPNENIEDGYVRSTEWRKNISKALTGKKRTKAQRKRIADSKRGWSPSLETKMKISSANTGRKRTPEQKRLMSESQKKRYAKQREEKQNENKDGV